MGRKVRAAASKLEALGFGPPTPFECGGLVACYPGRICAMAAIEEDTLSVSHYRIGHVTDSSSQREHKVCVKLTLRCIAVADSCVLVPG